MRIIEVHPNGLVITIRRSKTNQRGDDEELPPGASMAHRCPVATLQTWLEPAKITDLSAFQGEGGAGEGPGGLRGRAAPDVFRAAGLASHGARTGASRSRLDFRYGMSRG
ncbi:MAG TPA: hypothetical protein VFH76_22775 [Kribbella sp.]|nr:hypothetical protein [Kribbella sp.]